MSGPRLSIIPADAVLDPRLKARDLQVLCVFGKHSDKAGWCCRSQVKMAREMNCARSTVQASIERLVAAGWLQKRVLSTPHEAGERDSAHEYRVVLDVPDQTLDVVSTPADTSAPLPVQNRHPLPIHESAPMLTTPSLTKQQPRGKFDLDSLSEKLIEAAGDKIQPHGSIVLAPILGLIEGGCDLETDILPTIRARAAKLTRPAGSWAYFVQPIREAYEARIKAGAGLSQPKTVKADSDRTPEELERQWRGRLDLCRHSAQDWLTSAWGPMPGQPGCRVPEHLLQPSDGKGWREWKPEAA